MVGPAAIISGGGNLVGSAAKTSAGDKTQEITKDKVTNL
ncbi:MAG: hypothetical protein ACJAWQ_001319, partial [Paraglaciecola sp.]